MANFELNVMVALYWGGKIITEMNGFRTDCSTPFQQLLMCDQRSFGEGSSSLRHVDDSPREYEGR
ncbi:hypothetical protein KY285_010296 [Solanum tuberosum]|nr:hypothetical protein KY289_010839 [Solanum tuberosum]KAH0734589.1 hypothetical protein KY285_010296 [Solanum tuberosum]